MPQKINNCQFSDGKGGLSGRECGEIPNNFTISNEELLKGYKEVEQKKLDVVGIFHSHPHSEAIPSMTDKKFMGINPVVWVISNKNNELKTMR